MVKKATKTKSPRAKKKTPAKRPPAKPTKPKAKKVAKKKASKKKASKKPPATKPTRAKPPATKPTRAKKVAKKKAAKKTTRAKPKIAGKKKRTLITAYEKQKDRAGRRQKAASSESRDIGPLPAVVHPGCKKRGRGDLLYFCEHYFPDRFSLAWSPDHLLVIARIEETVLRGGLFALAMPRGSGKTAIIEVAILWAALYGHHNYIAGIGATAGHAQEILESIRIEIETNERLAGDFPEVCFPIGALERINQRIPGQNVDGLKTRITWKKDLAILPTVKGSPAAGVRIQVAGITGRIRGMKYTRTDGTVARPRLAIVDDPQTDESAASPTQNEKRERIVAGAVLGLAGPGQRISAVMPCTVIKKGDMADNLLDPAKNPEWRGQRTQMVIAWPTAEKQWSKYADLRREGLRDGDDGAAATAFYLKRFDLMNAGAVVSWPERYNKNELSAIQNAMNLRIRNEEAFFAEYQNAPIDATAESEFLTADEIAKKTNGLKRGQIPATCNVVTAFIDVHSNLLYWTVCAWEDQFTGYVIDYGTFPDQARPYFTMRQATDTLRRSYMTAGKQGAIYAGLKALVNSPKIAGKKYKRDDGVELSVGLVLIDAAWEPDVVFRFARQCRTAPILPARGLFLGGSSLPWDQRIPKKGERPGHHWRIAPAEGRAARIALSDVNFWKTFTQTRLAETMGDPGCLSLFGSTAAAHRLIADHCVAEYRITVEGRGRKVDEWKVRPARDNHYFDCLVGNVAAASMLGIQLFEKVRPARPPKRSAGHVRKLE